MDVVQLAKADGPKFDQAKFTGAAKHIHERQEFTPQMMQDEPVKALTRETYTALSAAINIGREVPPELRVALEENTFIFSGFKTYQQLRDVSGLLKDEDGGFKSFEAFSRDIQQLNDRYNKNYLRAEYNYATQSTQMAVKWHDFVADGDDYLLQYRTAGDDRVRADHAVLHNTTLPLNDPFWDEYMPPLDWGCRCTVVQVPKDKYPMSDSAEAIARGEAATDSPKKRMFRFNPGKTLKLFPPKHPYLPKGCGKCKHGLKLAYDANREACQVCIQLAQLKSKEFTIGVTKEEKNSARSLALEWAEKHLPKVLVGKTLACRAIIKTKDNIPIIINKDFINVTFAHNKNNPDIVQTMEFATKVSEWLPTATKIDTEDGIHHDFKFDVFVTTYRGYKLECKAKKTEGVILYNLKIEKES